jgi:AcrR family transcriptional regulator
MADVSRADAQRNRARILEVAHPALADDPNVSLNTVARLAGVGAGTLYRHFPNREALLLAVYQEEIDSLVAAVEPMLAEQPPLDAFRTWVRRLAADLRIKHGLGEALTSPAAQAAMDANTAPVTDAIGRFLEAAAARGDVASGADPGDVLLLLGALWRVPADAAGLERADRMLEMVIGSLRAAAPAAEA